ncbi:hypothetical protein HZP84_16270 [Elizabethkingia anophelis]|uniref:hypothetical protein n=1 Tax=Elizabethkingia TaxID=308865 RepID=UPI0009951D2F|nr:MULTISPECIES: hypothetical protein [Elizabethkingia]AQX12537.1 hypothetical protein BBD35_09205 [Elizabethkingia meningoseptica]MBG0514083.1 hypothetical protein [Elizabethkingia meningoseptica]MCT3693163.1 hypothetical protein [Elizabethkingia anophelis]MCT3824630.1 hypothetical protein [Elizabethkingia anophelis]MCT3835924.1 hypothetical protein [Elizabethkingia anophelis]
MKEFKLSSQNEHIKAIEEAFESYSVAIQLREKLDINIKRGEYSSTINFTVKDNQDINPIDFFWIGFMVRQDYL